MLDPNPKAIWASPLFRDREKIDKLTTIIETTMINISGAEFKVISQQ
jgi:hypothetical protein